MYMSVIDPFVLSWLMMYGVCYGDWHYLRIQSWIQLHVMGYEVRDIKMP